MGAQLSKSDDALLDCDEGMEENLHDYVQQNDTNEREEDQRLHAYEKEFMNELHETVIPDQYDNLLPMNEMCSNTLLSSAPEKSSSLTVASFAKINSDHEVDHYVSLSIANKGTIKREILTGETNLGLQNPDKTIISNFETTNKVELNKGVQIQFASDPENELINLNQLISDENSNQETINIIPTDPSRSIAIKLTEESNIDIQNPDEENSHLNSADLNKKVQIEQTFDPGTELENFNHGITDKVPNQETIYKADNANLDNVNLEQSLLVKIELIKEHLIKSENSEHELLAEDSNQEILISDQSYIAEVSTFFTKNHNEDPRNIEVLSKDIKRELIEVQVSENLNASDKESTQKYDLVENKKINENKNPLNIETPSKEIKTESVEVDVGVNCCTVESDKESVAAGKDTVKDSSQNHFLDRNNVFNENIDDAILTEESNREFQYPDKIIISNFEAINNVELNKRVQIQFANYPENELINLNLLISDKNSNQETINIIPKDSSQSIAIKLTEESNIDIQKSNIDIQNPDEENSNLNSAELNKKVQIEQTFDPGTELEKLNPGISDKEPNQETNIADKANLDKINLEQSRLVKIELINTHLIKSENSEHELLAEDSKQEILISDQSCIAELSSILTEDPLNIEVPSKDIKRELIEVQVSENLNTSDKESTQKYDLVENKKINENTNAINIETPSKEIKTESVEVDVGVNCCIVESDKESVADGKDTDKDSSQNHFLVRNSVFNENINDDPIKIQQTSKEIKVEFDELDDSQDLHDKFVDSNKEAVEDIRIAENFNTDFKNTNEDASQNYNLLENNVLNENITEQISKEIKVEPDEFDDGEDFHVKVVDGNEESVEENLNTGANNTNKDSSQNYNLLKNKNKDERLNIKETPVEIKAESCASDLDENTNINAEETNKGPFSKYNIVRNPFAFFKALYKQKKKQQTLTKPSDKVTLAKSEIVIACDEELTINEPYRIVVKKENITDRNKEPNTTSVNIHENILQKDETIPQTTNLNELTIKSETLDVFCILKHSTNNSNWNEVNVKQEQIEKSFENDELPFIELNDDTSLDVNVGNSSITDDDMDDIFFSQSADDLLSNSTQISLQTSEYHSIIEISSLEDVENIIPKSSVETTGKKLERRPGRPKGSTNLKPNIKTNKLSQRKTTTKESKKTKACKNYQRSHNKKPKKKQINPSKYTEKDTAFRIAHSTCFKNLPKTDIVRRSRETEKNNKIMKSVHDDFPKPFKLEMESNKEKDIATVLPKPIFFKSESHETHVNGTQSYKKPEFQPYVRLKRLRSEELLVPLKIRKISNNKKDYKKSIKPLRKSYPFVTNPTRRHSIHHLSMPAHMDKNDFLIQNAYSLSPLVKLNRWSVDEDNSFYNNNSGITTTSDATNDSESRYFSNQELLTLFQPCAPDGSPMLSGHFDSGVSTATPNASHIMQKDNKSILLEIAAERAFINNHLMHFGYSPIHFDLYNDINNLNAFLKYLFGQL